MNILAIDTTNEYLSLAIKHQEQVHHLQLKVDNKQSEQIIPAINKLLQENNLPLEKISGIAYNMGPGSFTGLRIGLSVAKSLAYSLNCTVFPIPTFLLYVQQIRLLHNFKYCLVTIDARLNQLYVALLKCDDSSFILQPDLINPMDLSSYLHQSHCDINDITVTGNGWNVYKSFIADELINLNYITCDHPSAQNMIQIYDKNIIKSYSAFDADLLYLRNKVALNIEEQKQNKTR